MKKYLFYFLFCFVSCLQETSYLFNVEKTHLIQFFGTNSSYKNVRMMSTSISPLKAMDGLTFPPNISNETMHEFLTIWMNMELTKNGTKTIKTPNETTDNCLHYCEHNIRDFFTQYQLYHGYITLVVSIKFQGFVTTKLRMKETFFFSEIHRKFQS